jgi:hypothetical protein
MGVLPSLCRNNFAGIFCNEWCAVTDRCSGYIEGKFID